MRVGSSNLYSRIRATWGWQESPCWDRILMAGVTAFGMLLTAAYLIGAGQ
jgi:hypothetical protein